MDYRYVHVCRDCTGKKIQNQAYLYTPRRGLTCFAFMNVKLHMGEAPLQGNSGDGENSCLTTEN